MNTRYGFMALNIEVGTGAIRRTISRRQGDERADAFVIGMAFSPDGKTLAYAHARIQIVLHDLASGQEADLGGTSLGEALTLAYRPDGAILASGDRGNIMIWDVASRALVRTLTDHREQLVCVAFSPDGRRFASASGDQTVRLWETETWKPLLTLRGHEEEVHAVAFSPDGRRLISGSNDETVRTWEVERTNRAADLLTLPEDKLKDGVDTEQLAILEAKLNAAKAGVAALQVVAPFDGTVAELNAKVGESVSAGSNAATVADFSSWLVNTTDLTELEVVNLRAGQPASVVLDAIPDVTLNGVVDAISQHTLNSRGTSSMR